MLNLKEILTERKSALIIIDVQNEFCHPDGALGQKGLDLSAVDKAVPNIQAIIDAAHRSNRPVIFIVNTEDEATDSEAWNMRPDGDENSPNVGVTRRGTWGAQLYLLKPEAGDYVVEKHRFSAFHNTKLNELLHSLGVETVVITGFATNVCVMTTATHAVINDYHVVLAEDACGAWFEKAHKMAVNNVRLFVGKVRSSAEIISCWDAR